jgi:hypothetical protein
MRLIWRLGRASQYDVQSARDTIAGLQYRAIAPRRVQCSMHPRPSSSGNAAYVSSAARRVSSGAARGLARFSDRELADLGLTPRDIPAVVRGERRR